MEKINWKIVGLVVVAGVIYWYIFLRGKSPASANTKTDPQPVSE